MITVATTSSVKRCMQFSAMLYWALATIAADCGSFWLESGARDLQHIRWVKTCRTHMLYIHVICACYIYIYIYVFSFRKMSTHCLVLMVMCAWVMCAWVSCAWVSCAWVTCAWVKLQTICAWTDTHIILSQVLSPNLMCSLTCCCKWAQQCATWLNAASGLIDANAVHDTLSPLIVFRAALHESSSDPGRMFQRYYSWC